MQWNSAPRERLIATRLKPSGWDEVIRRGNQLQRTLIVNIAWAEVESKDMLADSQGIFGIAEAVKYVLTRGQCGDSQSGLEALYSCDPIHARKCLSVRDLYQACFTYTHFGLLSEFVSAEANTQKMRSRADALNAARRATVTQGFTAKYEEKKPVRPRHKNGGCKSTTNVEYRGEALPGRHHPRARWATLEVDAGREFRNSRLVFKVDIWNQADRTRARQSVAQPPVGQNFYSLGSSFGHWQGIIGTGRQV
ncbi:hypothetical protein K438DRAFT_1791852 [Mycena galopus ATCC 62051]|nr:hypothetical protein K438DRAFT_1791852 [Mycena galopus ATCC 62051]